jgi:hypothetical protein
MPIAANASIETDKSVGLCVNYLILIQKSNAANIALRQADNQSRAMQFAKTEMNEVKRMSTAGTWNSAAQQSYALKADSACRKLVLDRVIIRTNEKSVRKCKQKK